MANPTITFYEQSSEKSDPKISPSHLRRGLECKLRCGLRRNDGTISIPGVGVHAMTIYFNLTILPVLCYESVKTIQVIVTFIEIIKMVHRILLERPV
jgi:hypothetical protein